MICRRPSVAMTNPEWHRVDCRSDTSHPSNNFDSNVKEEREPQRQACRFLFLISCLRVKTSDLSSLSSSVIDVSLLTKISLSSS